MFSNVEYLDGNKEQVQQVIRPGQVKATFQNGDIFNGSYISAGGNRGYVRTGKGEYIWKSGAKYSGNYVNGKRHGTGTYVFSSGEIYEGLWENGLKHGKGKYIYTNGDTFYGTWVADKRNGKGRFVYANKQNEIIGEWKDGELIEETYKEVVPPEDNKPKVEEPVVKEAPKEEDKDIDALDKAEAAAEEQAKEPVKEPKEDEKPEEIEPLDKVRDFAVIETGTDEQTAKEPLGIIIAGAPASGKGSQCENIKKEFGVVHLSSGDILRDTVAAGSEAGLKAKEYMEKGELVPDEIVIACVKDRLEQDDVKENGFLLDGFPRSAGQAEELKNMGVKIHICLMLTVEEEKLIERAVGRRMDPETGKIYHLKFFPPPEDDEALLERLIQRKDDNEATMINRIEIFNSNVNNLREFYADIMHEIDGNRDKAEIWDDINEKIQNLLNIEKALEESEEKGKEKTNAIADEVKDKEEEPVEPVDVTEVAPEVIAAVADAVVSEKPKEETAVEAPITETIDETDEVEEPKVEEGDKAEEALEETKEEIKEPETTEDVQEENNEDIPAESALNETPKETEDAKPKVVEEGGVDKNEIPVEEPEAKEKETTPRVEDPKTE